MVLTIWAVVLTGVPTKGWKSSRTLLAFAVFEDLSYRRPANQLLLTAGARLVSLHNVKLLAATVNASYLEWFSPGL
jgi:hypothetical protein